MRHRIKTIAVDLTPLRPGGANGGIKPLIIESLKAVSDQLFSLARFVYFTNSVTHNEVRNLAKYGDKLVCIILEPNHPYKSAGPQIYADSHDRADNRRLLIEHDADILYCPFGAATLACPGIATVSCIVDLLHKDFPDSLPAAEIDHRESYLKQTIQVSDTLNCISKYVIERVKECYPRYGGTFFHTYNTIQNRLARITPTPADIPAKPYFFYPANYWLHKNHEGLLIGYQMYLHKTGDSARDLVLTGHDDERSDEIKKTAQALGIGRRIKFLGHVSESQLTTIWGNCYALVFPSLHEGFGIPLLEAMHFGKPVICSNSCCLPEIGGDAVHYINARRPEEIAEALLKLDDDSAYTRQLADKAKARLADFSFEQEMKKLGSELFNAHPTRRWHKHIYADGWFSTLALIAIPSSPGRHQLVLELSGPHETTLVTIYAGKLPLGTHRIYNPNPHKLEFYLREPTGCLRLEIKSPLSSQKREGQPLGARIHSIILVSESGQKNILACF